MPGYDPQEGDRISPVPPVGEPRGVRRLLRLAAMNLAPLRRRRDFRLLFVGPGLSFFGSMLTYVAIPYQASAFFARDTFSCREVHTNLETGLSFVVRGHGVFNEVRATPLGGTLFAFEAVEAGQPFVIEDAEGNLVVRDRGALRHRIVFDALGDDVPGGIVIEEFGSSVHGPHPGFAEDFRSARSRRS